MTQSRPLFEEWHLITISLVNGALHVRRRRLGEMCEATETACFEICSWIGTQELNPSPPALFLFAPHPTRQHTHTPSLHTVYACMCP